MIKKFSIIAIALIMVLAFVYFSKLLVIESFFYNTNKSIVQENDVLKNQSKVESDILTDFNSSTFDQENPYVIMDPYQMNPLSALVLFNSNIEDTYTITIKSIDELNDYQYQIGSLSGMVELPIIGLYAKHLNVVTIESSTQVSTISIQTDELPYDFQDYSIIQKDISLMEDGMTLMIATFEHSYTAVIDANANVRAYLSNKDIAHGTSIIQLRNGHLLLTGDQMKQVPYNQLNLWEIDWLGKLYKEIEVPNGVHHDLFELPDGNILAASNDANMFVNGTREDMAIIIDYKTGQVIEEIDFRKILNENRNIYHHFDPNIINPINIDWMHINAVLYDKNSNSIIASSPTQSQVVSIDAETYKINWILGSHDGYETSEKLKQYLLTPIGDDFSWQWGQHHPMVIDDLDHNPSTIEILMFDNGQNKSVDKSNAVDASENTSRAVLYQIDNNNMIVKELWSFGFELGNDYYSTFLGDADVLPITNNKLITFGGHLTSNGETVDEILGGVVGNVSILSHVVEVTNDQKVVWDVAVTARNSDTSAETYQAERISLESTFNENYSTFNLESIRIGDKYLNEQDLNTKVPNIFFGDFNGELNKIYLKDNILVIDGNLFYKNESKMLSQARIVLRNFSNTYVFYANSGLYGRFFSNIDLSKLEKGTYSVQIICAYIEGNDTKKEITAKGYFNTEYSLNIN